MTKIADILLFLQSNQLLVEAIINNDTRPVEGVASDNEAGAGQMVWISCKNLDRNPLRWRSFNGSLLLLPDSAEIESPLAFSVARVFDPKLVFIRVVGHCF